MADLNSMIAQGAQFQAPIDPFVQYGRMQQLQQGQQTNALNQMKMDEYQRGLQEQNALRQLNPNASDYETQLFKVNPTLGIAYRKEAATAAAQQATAEEQRAKSAAARQAVLGQAYRDISSRPSDANITAHMENVLVSPLFKAEEKASVQKLAQTLLGMPLDQRQAYLQTQGAKTSDLKPTTQTVNRAGATDVIQVPAFGGLPTTVGSYADVPLPANVQAQKIQIARESRPPAQPRAEQPLEKVIDPVSGKIVFVSREEALKGRMTPASELQGLPAKEIQKRESVLPQATQSVKATEQNADSLIADLQALKDHAGLSGITGFIAGRTTNLSGPARSAQADFNKIKAQGTLGVLTALRAASKTGGALGNTSDKDVQLLGNAFGALDQTQNTEDFKNKLDDAIYATQRAKQNAREAYDSTYEYKSGGTSAPAAPPNKPAATLSPADKQALDWANSNPKDPRAFQIKQRLGQ